jgi:N-acetylglucosamine kinase-like BadF-type ATPase
MTAVLVGLDVGGTKTAVLATTLDGAPVLDTTLHRIDWEAEPVDLGARWLVELLRTVLPTGTRVIGLGVGAQGLDTTALATGLADELRARGLPARCVNDAALLVPAAGLSKGLGLIAGTGAIVVGTDPTGELVIAGGWGSVIGDDAGAAGLVREATKAALAAHDDGEPDDGLLSVLLAAFDVPTPERLARSVNDNPTPEHWGTRAPAVFAAADRGSALASRVVGAAAEHLARLVDQTIRRGATGHDVLCAGSVIVNQPRLFDAVAAAVTSRHPEVRVRLLEVRPVVGALALARVAQRGTPVG